MDAEENQHRQVVSVKKKSQKLSQDAQDLRFQLDDQLTRNSDLEKKQRRFDSEMNKLLVQLQEEKSARERLQRERDDFASDKFMLEQQLKVCHLLVTEQAFTQICWILFQPVAVVIVLKVVIVIIITEVYFTDIDYVCQVLSCCS